MNEEVKRLIEDVGACFDSALGRIDRLRRELREELDGQRAALSRFQRAMAALETSLDRSLTRQTASIDQSFAEFGEDMQRGKKGIGIVLTSMLEKTARREELGEVRHRVDELERRLAG